MSERSNVLFLFTALFLALSAVFNSLITIPYPTVNLQNEAYNFNKKTEIFNLGQKRALSSLLWVKTLLDADVEHYKEGDLNSWLYLRFRTILNLDPKFLEAYRFGGLYLSIAKDDIKAASIIFERGLKQYPNDYFLNLYAGYHFYLEDPSYNKSLKYFKRAAQSPQATEFIYTLITTLMRKSRKSKEEIKIEILKSLNIVNDPLIKKNLLDKLEGLDN